MAEVSQRDIFERELKEQEERLVKILIAGGMSEGEARAEAKKQTDSMGAVKTARGECPIGGANPMACMFCSFGHMTDCHYPETCEEARCSHYQEELEAGI